MIPCDSQPAAAPSQRLLVVDDEAETLSTLELTLRAHGFDEIETAANGAEALAAMQREAVGAILMDLTMPGLCGPELLEHVVQTRPTAPVVVVTALSDTETALRCMRLGAVNYLTKPVSAARLVEAARAALDVHAQRIRHQERARCAQRFEAIGQMATGIAHDFNNLLQIVVGACQVARDVAGPPAAEQQLLRALRAAELAGASAQRLLAFARGAPEPPKQVDLSELCGQFGTFLQPVMRHDIRLELAFATPELPVSVARGDLQHALLNLCINAQEAMPEGGALRLRTGLRGAAPGDTHAFVEVHDSGHGMDAETRALALRPYFTTKAEGTGLGLTIVSDFALAHGGTLEIESTPGEGSVFRLCLPLAEAPPPAT